MNLPWLMSPHCLVSVKIPFSVLNVFTVPFTEPTNTWRRHFGSVLTASSDYRATGVNFTHTHTHTLLEHLHTHTHTLLEHLHTHTRTPTSVSCWSPQHSADTSWSRLRQLISQKLKACFLDRLTPEEEEKRYFVYVVFLPVPLKGITGKWHEMGPSLH